MGRWLKFFIDICRLKAAPQDAPLSKNAQYLSIFSYWSLGLTLLLFTYELPSAAIVATVQTVLAMFLVYLVLWIKNVPARIPQALTAYMGAGSVVVVVALPFFWWMSGANPDLEQFYFIVWLGLLIWETVVTGHILRHALSVPFIAGLGVALVFMYLTFVITVRFLKILSYNLN